MGEYFDLALIPIEHLNSEERKMRRIAGHQSFEVFSTAIDALPTIISRHQISHMYRHNLRKPVDQFGEIEPFSVGR